MFGNVSLGAGYLSRTQQARRISEDWITRFGYCLKCDSDHLTPTSPNTKTRDFICPKCEHAYELKSKCGAFTTRIVDGSYVAMLDTIRSNRTPTFLLLQYTSSWSIFRLTAIHHSLISEEAILPRRPLAKTARRAGWIGCSIALPAIALVGKIDIVVESLFQPPARTRAAFACLEGLSQLPHTRRSWAAAVLNIIYRLSKSSFSLADVYAFELELQAMYPENKNIRPKIRQQLQVLRDNRLIRFIGKGQYQIDSGHSNSNLD